MHKIGIMGSAFNPPTKGHLNLIEQALCVVDEVWLVPSYAHAFGKEMISYESRCNLVNAFILDINNPKVKAKCIEHTLYHGAPVYTWDLLSEMEQIKPSGTQIVFIMGPDNKENWDKFYKASEIKEKWGIWAGQGESSIRSTLVRERISKQECISDLVTKRVEKEVQAHGLYSSGERKAFC